MLAGDGGTSGSTAVAGGLAAFYSDDGVGCNEYETAALIRMLDSRDAAISAAGTIGGSGSGSGDLRALSREYRRAVRDCMGGWDEHIRSTAADAADAAAADDAEAGAGNLELLKITSAIIHLSEIYLLPRPAAGGGNSNTVMMMDIDDDSANAHDANLPGSVTADTVRYLRFNHLPDVYDAIGTTAEEVERMINSEQPEHYDGDGDGGGGALFWNLVDAHAMRGCLAEAWAVLTHHSAVRRFSAAAARGDLDGVGGGAVGAAAAGAAALVDDPVLLEDRDAFAMLKGLMFCAPIPGGIDQANDAGLDSDEDDDDEDNAEMMGLDEAGGDDYTRLVAGVPRDSYKMWDGGDDDGAASGGESGRAGGRRNDAIPGSFHPKAAANRHRTWSALVNDAVNQSGPLQSLTRRIPRIRRLLSILGGRFGDSSGVSFRSWDEALVAELLYVRPSIRPIDIAVRAQIAMKRHGLDAGEDDSATAVEGIVLSVMRGDAGSAVISLQSYGGSSGAALPATMASLLCDLLTSAGRIQPSMLTYDLQTNLQLSASASILSSFASQSQHSVGVRLSTRLLLPHATPANVRVTSTLAETLGRHWPRTDAEASGLLSLCEDLTLRGSVRVADACDSICWCRYQHHASNGMAGGAALWLLRGVDIWSSLRAALQEAKGEPPSLLEVELAGSSGRRFVTICTETSRALLAELANSSDDGEALTHHHKIAKDMLEAIMEGELAHLIRRDQSVALLQHVFDIADATVANNNGVIAQNVVNCLDERVDAEGDGSVKILAPPSMHANLLSLALDVLEKENAEVDGTVAAQEPRSSSSFEVNGIQALMARFAQLTFNATLSPEMMRDSSLGGKNASTLLAESSAKLPFEEQRMRKELCNGLMRAFVSENAKRKKDASDTQRLDAGIGRQVDLMLGPSM